MTDKDAEIAALKAEVARLKDGLAFYRDAWVFKTSKHRPGLEWRPAVDLLDDCGNRARALLNQDKTNG